MKFKLTSYWNYGNQFALFAERLGEAGFKVSNIDTSKDEAIIGVKDLEELVKLHRIVGNIAIQSFQGETIELYCFEGGFIE